MGLTDGWKCIRIVFIDSLCTEDFEPLCSVARVRVPCGDIGFAVSRCVELAQDCFYCRPFS